MQLGLFVLTVPFQFVCDVCEDGGEWRKLQMKMGNDGEGEWRRATPTATSTLAALPIATVAQRGKGSKEAFLVQSSDNLHLHPLIINKISF